MEGKRLTELAARLSETGHVLYVDCANRFDPYELFRTSRDESCLERVHVCRPFTAYQLRELVFQKLEPAIQYLGSQAMLFAGIDSYGTEGPMDEKELILIRERVVARIASLAKDYGIYAAISYGGDHGTHC